MDHGFTNEHFQLLRKWKNHHYDGENSQHVHAYERLREAYAATQAWADSLQARLFPHGEIEIHKAVINQGHVFSPYTWAKIYPSPAAPRVLAFTVGVDEDGFTVKIDRVGTTPVRAAYEALRAGPNAHSPFGEVLAIADGLKLSFEELVDWSAKAIGRFRMSYEEVLERIGLGAPQLTMVSDEAASRAAFASWRNALLDGAVRRGSLFWLLEGGIVFRPRRSGRTADDDRMELGVDPTGRNWAVQINEPRIAGDHNSLSAIGLSAGGERFLLRQGFLRPNETGGRTIAGEEFVGRTGLAPAAVEATGLAGRRQWFRVCSLDSNPEQMRIATSRFVDRCAAARASDDAGEPPLDVAADNLFSGAEAGGSYTRRAREAEGERTIVRSHGAVWLALADLIFGAGLRIRKGRHPLGFEVDAEIDGGAVQPLLVEIKTAVSAGDIHGGVGQLHLYPKLIPRLATYRRALLLPGIPAVQVRAAVEGCGIEVHSFKLEEREGQPPRVTFSGPFLSRCGLESPAEA
jgi:hypothetical protein